MNFEEEIFKKCKVNTESLILYGFVKEENVYKYSKRILDSFMVNIEISESGFVKGKIFDLIMKDEYTAFRIKKQNGEFVNNVRSLYQDILLDIKEHCYMSEYFMFDQANRLTQEIFKMYHDRPQFLWENDPGSGVFRNSDSEKWYGLIMNVDKSKIEEDAHGRVEILNVKLHEDKVQELVLENGFYEAYHMNKKNWITIILDETVDDNLIIDCIKESQGFSIELNEWIVPANPHFYDVINCFNDKDVIEWKQSNNNIKVGNIVYLYVGSPYSAILYKCKVVEVNIPYEYKDKNISMSKVMKLRYLKKYDNDLFSFSKLNELGIKAIRGPIRVPENLRKVMNEVD